MSFSLPLSIVVASHNTVATLRAALAAIRAAEMSRNDYELIVVDDASSDASATVAARYADTVIRLRGHPLGLAYARNRGAELAKGEIVAFVDPNVLVKPNTLPRMLAIFAEQPTVDAVCTAHDDAPAATNFVSQYWNLLLHFGEQRYVGESGDLASGCSGVRRSALMGVGMYDEWRFRSGCLEGVELGQRLQCEGSRVVVSQTLQITHLSKWSFGSVIREIWSRSKMLSRSVGYQRTRVAVPSEVVFTLSRAMPPALAVVSIVALSGAFLPAPSWAAKGTVAFLGILLANTPVYGFYARSRGLAFTVAAMPLHILAQSVAAIALCTGWALRETVGDRSPDATTQAYAEVGLEIWPPVPRQR